jgi:Xaa-Pro aminopeptidase
MRKLLLLLLVAYPLYAQPFEPDMNVFARRRADFMQRMDTAGTAIFPCKPQYQRNLDIEYDYRQESNFYYLSGFTEPQAIMVIAPWHPRFRYILFVQKRNRGSEIFQGKRYGTDGAIKEFLADTAFVVDDFSTAIWRFVRPDRPLYYTFGINPDIDAKITTNFLERRSAGNWAVTDPAPIVAEMRLIKNDGDWSMGFSKAVAISEDAHNAVYRFVKPGMYEYELQAVFEGVYRREGSPRNAYPCIIGSGPNATTLHYDANSRKIRDGELVLMDCAAEYGYYAADITRTIPANGKFSDAQSAVYKLVFDAQSAAISLVKPGIPKNTLDLAIDSVLSNGLLKLGFIKEKKDFRLYTLHGYSHWLGLDVHDVGSYTKNGKSRLLEQGMVFTIEPGLYVRDDIFDALKERGYTDADIARLRGVLAPYMNIGVRIEDDVLVTGDGCKVLSAGVPRALGEIEAAMKQR